MKLKPLHTGISVKDMDASITWYQDVMGFHLVSLSDYDQLQSKVAFMQNDDFQIELFEHRETLPLPQERLAPNSDIRTQGTKHICFGIGDINEAYRVFKEKGVDIAFGPTPMEGKMMGFIRDPSGVLIELIESE